MMRIWKRIGMLGPAGPSQCGRNWSSLPQIVRSNCLSSPRRLCSNALFRYRILRNIAFFVAVVALSIQPAGVLRAAQTPDAGAFLADLNERMMEQITETGIGQEEQQHRFRALLKESFNVPTIGRFVLGRYWRVASEHEQQAFLEVFEDVIVRSFLPLFIENSNARLDIGRMHWDSNSSHYVIVRSRVWRAPSDVLRVDWRGQECPTISTDLDICWHRS